MTLPEFSKKHDGSLRLTLDHRVWNARPPRQSSKARDGLPWFDTKWSANAAPPRPTKASKAPGQGYDCSPAKGIRTRPRSRHGGPAGALPWASVTEAAGRPAGNATASGGSWPTRACGARRTTRVRGSTGWHDFRPPHAGPDY